MTFGCTYGHLHGSHIQASPQLSPPHTQTHTPTYSVSSNPVTPAPSKTGSGKDWKSLFFCILFSPPEISQEALLCVCACMCEMASERRGTFNFSSALQGFFVGFLKYREIEGETGRGREGSLFCLRGNISGANRNVASTLPYSLIKGFKQAGWVRFLTHFPRRRTGATAITGAMTE